jgi:hypothetical protein
MGNIRNVLEWISDRSALPCTNIPFDRLLEERVLPYLNPEGIFVQYMHMLSFLRGMFPRTFLESRFESVMSEVVWFNIPPLSSTPARNRNTRRAIYETKKKNDSNCAVSY